MAAERAFRAFDCFEIVQACFQLIHVRLEAGILFLDCDSLILKQLYFRVDGILARDFLFKQSGLFLKLPDLSLQALAFVNQSRKSRLVAVQQLKFSPKFASPDLKAVQQGLPGGFNRPDLICQLVQASQGLP